MVGQVAGRVVDIGPEVVSRLWSPTCRVVEVPPSRCSSSSTTIDPRRNRPCVRCVLAGVPPTAAFTTVHPDAMTPSQIPLVQSSFHQVLPIAEAAGLLLYGRIFA